MNVLVAFLTGCVFALGLGFSGMVVPQKVIGFLDVQNWDPSLLLVMGAAVCTSMIGWRLRKGRTKPLFAAAFPALPAPRIDLRLCLGAALFGVGWGLSGICPGPALFAFAAGREGALLFVPAMLAGMLLFELVDRALSAARTAREGATTEAG